ncbi:hypothetical protein [Mesonia aestuariivivens]|uniref:DUF5673 domain-containing protein n=1 Tax=Mesonia aestuariivivens TaxID=2796128 RepID=A0ABS6W415_9FLAO|nr:hypothetical protein [Mesonia aestuariivivens]MBW2962617.1 hypothetical protein [Mesonia aestuariivivens]
MNNNKNNNKRVLEVYVLPILVIIFLIAISTVFSKYLNLNKSDSSFDFFIALGVGLFFHFWKKINWISLPDGSHLKVKNSNNNHKSSIGYKQLDLKTSNSNIEFRNSLDSKVVSLICGFIAIIAGIYIFPNSGFLLTISLISVGILVLHQGINGLLNRTPELVLNNEGIWTKELNFEPWKRVIKTSVVKQKIRYNYSTYLEIYLCDYSNEIPKQRLNLDDIKNKEQIKTTIDKLNKKN